MKLRGRASLRVPIRIDRVVAGMGFVSFEPGRFGSDDVPVATRLADHVAIGLSHYRLAEEGRHRRSPRAREQPRMLDGLLDTLAGMLDLRPGLRSRVCHGAKVPMTPSPSRDPRRRDDSQAACDPRPGRVPRAARLGRPIPPWSRTTGTTASSTTLVSVPSCAGGPGAATSMQSMLFVSIKLERGATSAG